MFRFIKTIEGIKARTHVRYIFARKTRNAAAVTLLLATALTLQISDQAPPVTSAALAQTANAAGVPSTVTATKLQGFSPIDMAVTKDGTHAYIAFNLNDVIFKVRLRDMTVQRVANLSSYFPMQNRQLMLDASEKKLFVGSATWRKLFVLDTATMKVVRTIDNIEVNNVNNLALSADGASLIVGDSSNLVRLINTTTYQVTVLRDERIGFLNVRPSKLNANNWFVVTQYAGVGWAVGTYDYQTKAWNYTSFPGQGQGEGFFDFEIMPNEQKAYLATFGGWRPDGQGYGWLYSVDLLSGQTKTIPIDGGAFSLQLSGSGDRLYIGTGWPKPAPEQAATTNSLLVLDTSTDSLLGPIRRLGRTNFKMPYTEVNDLAISPGRPRILFAASGDANALMKVDLARNALVRSLIFNREDVGPHAFVRRPNKNRGFLLDRRARAFDMDLSRSKITRVWNLPVPTPDAGQRDAVITNDGRLLIAEGSEFVEADVDNEVEPRVHQLPANAGMWRFTLSRNQKTLYSIATTSAAEYRPNIFMAIDAKTFKLRKRLKLAGGAFAERPFELPNGKKLYAVGGMHDGQVVIKVIKTAPYSVKKTISFNQPGLLGISAGPYYPFAYDSRSRTLFVGATHVVLAIDTVRDEIKEVIKLEDVPRAVGLEPWQLTYINAVGLVYHPRQRQLYIAHFDRSFMSIWDSRKHRFLPRLISLKGWSPSYLFANEDYSRIYSLNARSDNVSVVGTRKKSLLKVIDLY